MNVAIKGHQKKGKKVIEILEMLGGKNSYDAKGDCINLLYILCDDEIQYIHYTDAKTSVMNIFTLEEFLEKFPYKVGDKVCFPDDLSTPFTINKMWWDENANELLCSFIEDDIEVPVVGIRTYKEETMKQIKIDIPKGYEFFGIDDDNKIVLAEKQPQYPKTYEECCKIKHSDPNFYIDTHLYSDKLDSLYKLLICRNAYWKIAGEEMGLGKHWEPTTETVYCISRNDNVIKCSYRGGKSNILEFPTPEIRDIFYENFKELIENCKELL